MARTGLLSIMVLLAAGSVAYAINGDGGYQSQQGIWLHGTAAPFEDVDIPFAGATQGGRPYTTLRVEAGQLRGTLDRLAIDGASVVGMQLSVPSYVLTIAGARPHNNIYTCERAGWEYRVEWRAQPPTSPKDLPHPLCAPDQAAVAVPGSWSTGQLQPSDAVFTFACVPVAGAAWGVTGARKPAVVPPLATLPPGPRVGPATCVRPVLTRGGVIAKCIDYGYAPWAQGTPALARASRIDGSRLPNTDDTARQLHNLCAVAMRADYGGNSAPHTLGGTPIRLYDATNLGAVSCEVVKNQLSCHAPTAQTFAPPGAGASAAQIAAVGSPIAGAHVELPIGEIEGLVIEGIWTMAADGKLGAPPRARALCLSKERWGAVDPSAVAMRPLASRGRQICDARTLASLASIKPLMISYSASVDRGLHRFSNGTDQITTTHVVIDAGGTFALDPKFCPAGSAFDCRSYHHEAFEGTILAPDLGDLITQFQEYEPRRLSSYRSGARMVTTTDDVAAQVAPKATLLLSEGYVFGRPPELSPADFPLVDSRNRPIARRIDNRTLTLWQLNGAYTTSVAAPAGGHTTRTPLGTLLRSVAMLTGFPPELVARVSIGVASARSMSIGPLPANTLAPSPATLPAKPAVALPPRKP